jgi:hypothetical protein
LKEGGIMPETQTPNQEAVTGKDLFVACINLKWPETGDQNKAMKIILEHPKIKRRIEFEAKRFSDMNAELDKDELFDDIQTILYLAIKNEFSLQKDPTRMESWLCARVGWRSLDHVARQCHLTYGKDKNGDGEYKRTEKLPLDTIDQSHFGRSTIAFGDQMPAGIERHPTFESFLRKAHIRISHKHVLMYVITMSYNFRELADIYGVSSPTARKLYKRAVDSLKRYVSGLTPAEQLSIQNLLRRVSERE